MIECSKVRGRLFQIHVCRCTWTLVRQLAAGGRIPAGAEDLDLLDSAVEKDRQVPNYA